jgi:hypothetical protein
VPRRSTQAGTARSQRCAFGSAHRLEDRPGGGAVLIGLRVGKGIAGVHEILGAGLRSGLCQRSGRLAQARVPLGVDLRNIVGCLRREVNDHLRQCALDGAAQLASAVEIGIGRRRAQRAQVIAFAGAARHADCAVPGGYQLANERLADRSHGAGDKHSHRLNGSDFGGHDRLDAFLISIISEDRLCHSRACASSRTGWQPRWIGVAGVDDGSRSIRTRRMPMRIRAQRWVPSL